MELDFSAGLERLARTDPVRISGRVTDVIGLVVEGSGPGLPVGGLCEIVRRPGLGTTRVDAEVVGFRRGERKSRVLLMPLGEVRGIEPGSRIVVRGERPTAAVGPALLGRVLDGLGAPLDDRGPLRLADRVPLHGRPINPLERAPIRQPLDLGVRALNGMLTCGLGGRLGIFAGSGVGKSSLLGMIARSARADVNVIGLIGERGREVREFIERDLGAEGMARSVVVTATSEQPPLVRLRAAHLATAIAEYFRSEGSQVILMMDSLTRVAMAQREIGLSIGEPPSARGYTPSVFALLPQLVERAGVDRRGGITGLYTVLVDGDDMNEPIADATRGLLDGHVVLSRALADEGHFPAIDVLSSLSRLMPEITAPEHVAAASQIRSSLATYRDAKDLIDIGAYQPGTNERIDRAIAQRDAIRAFLRQSLDENVALDTSIQQLRTLVGGG